MSNAQEKPVTLVNVLKVDPTHQDQLVSLINESIDTIIHHLPGWVSSDLIAGLDGSVVVIISRWRTADHVNGMRTDARLVAYLEKIRALATFESFVGRDALKAAMPVGA